MAMLNAGAARTLLGLAAPVCDPFWTALTAAGSLLPANAAGEVDESAATALGQTPEWEQLMTDAAAAGADVAKIATAIDTFRAAVAAREKAEAASAAKWNRVGRYAAAAALLIAITLGVLAASGVWPFAGGAATDLKPLTDRVAAVEVKADESEKALLLSSTASAKFTDAIARLDAGHADHEKRIGALEARPIGVTSVELEAALAKAIAAAQKPAGVVGDPGVQQPRRVKNNDPIIAEEEDRAEEELVACPDPAPAPKTRVTKKATSTAPRKGTQKAIVGAKKAAPTEETFATKGDVEEVATKVDSLEERLTGDEMALSGHFTGQAKREEERCNPQAAANAAALGVFFGGRRNSSK